MRFYSYIARSDMYHINLLLALGWIEPSLWITTFVSGHFLLPYFLICTGTGIRQVDPGSLIRLTWELQRRVTKNGRSICGCLYFANCHILCTTRLLVFMICYGKIRCLVRLYTSYSTNNKINIVCSYTFLENKLNIGAHWMVFEWMESIMTTVSKLH